MLQYQHYFLNTIGKKGFVTDFYDHIPIEFKDFIYRVIPPELRDPNGKNVTVKGRLLLDTEYTTPLEILERDDFLKEFRKKPKDNLTLNINTISMVPTLKLDQTIFIPNKISSNDEIVNYSFSLTPESDF